MVSWRGLSLALLPCILFAAPVLGSVLEGQVLGWEDYRPVGGAVVRVFLNGSLTDQATLGTGGEYRFEVAPGTYVINAFKSERGNVSLISRVNITILPGKNTTRLDLLLFPPLEIPDFEKEIAPFGLEDLNLTLPPEPSPPARAGGGLPWLPAGLVAAAILGAVLLLYRRRSAASPPAPFPPSPLTPDEESVLRLIEERGGEVLQNELVRIQGVSAAKVSLTLTGLERKGKIEKLMRGRTNLIRIKKG